VHLDLQQRCGGEKKGTSVLQVGVVFAKEVRCSSGLSTLDKRSPKLVHRITSLWLFCTPSPVLAGGGGGGKEASILDQQQRTS
jgi:hypothetical protein